MPVQYKVKHYVSNQARRMLHHSQIHEYSVESLHGEEQLHVI